MADQGVAGAGAAKFLPRLIAAFEGIPLTEGEGEAEHPLIPTAAFAAACEPLLDAFQLMGSVFSWAQTDFEQKRHSVADAAAELPSLQSIVEKGRKDKTLAVKNSVGRNLHRLKCGVHFIVALLERLCSSSEVTMHEAAGEAYAKTLQPIHNWAVQAAVQASLLTCPSRQYFLQSINETDQSAAELALRFAKVADPVVAAVDALFADDIPPPSTNIAGGGWGW
eukprot:CAMPEP_0177766912 /NCGR_PEP_ID=MMETSP0491_2-20121128/8780_1 /TAXON_ID=63592 /ORGANISM="Tetraselmis chuii, Strain PLY429" /LENGTH=222 /DNA_ID=CAMNT_0019283363 /DNA_START=92 /DNA_END=758 /DNA_ORIENTATION=+